MTEREKRLLELSEALQEFASSSRFNFLKTLQVGRFLRDDSQSVGVVSGFTFEKLVELGTRKIAKLRWLNDEQEQTLVSLLRALTNGENEVSLAPPRISTRPPFPTNDNDEESSEETLGSVEVEQRLRKYLQQLRGHPDFTSVSSQPIGNFWGEHWPRAPFEEALTLEQMAEMDLTIILKKRTMTNQRIDRMARAAECALARLNESGAEQVKTTSATPYQKPEPPRLTLVENTPRENSTAENLPGRSELDISSHRWMSEGIEVSPLILAGAERFLQSCLTALTHSNGLDSVAAELPNALMLREFLMIIQPDWSNERMTPGMQLWVTTPEFSSRTQLLSAALAGPGIHISRISELFEILKGSVAELAALVILRLLGATETRLDAQICGGVWTLNPDLLGAVIRGLRTDRKLALDEALEKCCPTMDSHLKSWILPKVQRSAKRRVITRRKNVPD